MEGLPQVIPLTWLVGMDLVVDDEVIDGVEAHVVYEVVLGLASFRLGVDTTVVVATVPPTQHHNSNNNWYHSRTSAPETGTGASELVLQNLKLVLQN